MAGKSLDLTVRNIAFIAVMAALSVVLVYMVRIPWPALPFLEYDPADVPIYLTTFAFGPLVGFILTIIVSLVQGFTVSAPSGIIGILMHVAATGSFVLLAGNIYKRNRTKKGAVIALLAGVGIQTVAMIFWNILFTPIFMGIPREEVLGLLGPGIIPFNLVKGGINAALTFVLYKAVRKLFNTVGASANAYGKKSSTRR